MRTHLPIDGAEYSLKLTERELQLSSYALRKNLSSTNIWRRRDFFRKGSCLWK